MSVPASSSKTAYAGLKWVVEHGELLNINPADVVVMGASSGGNLAAAVCLLARERGGPAIRAQVLHVPALDLTGGSPSLHEQPGLWEGLAPVVALYADAEQVLDPLASPLLADDLSGLPPAVIVTGDHDPLRDDGSRYAARLGEAGVDATLLEFPMLHNIALAETTERMYADMAASIHATSFHIWRWVVTAPTTSEANPAWTVERGYEPVRDAFVKGMGSFGFGGGAYCAYVGGRPVIDLWGGNARDRRSRGRPTRSRC